MKKVSRYQQHIKAKSSPWEVVAWISETPSSNYRVLDVDGRFIGMIWGQTLRRLVAGEIKGCPIKAQFGEGVDEGVLNNR